MEVITKRVGKVEKRAEKVKEDLEGVKREIVNGMGKRWRKQRKK